MDWVSGGPYSGRMDTRSPPLYPYGVAAALLLATVSCQKGGVASPVTSGALLASLAVTSMDLVGAILAVRQVPDHSDGRQ